MPEAACTDHGLRQEVATCTRLLQMLGILGYSGHVSVRVPGDEAFLIQPIDRSRADVVPSDLMLVDLSGDLIPDEDGENELRPPSERFIHSEILRARGDVNAVAHFHADVTTVFSLTPDTPIRPVKNHAARWRHGIPVHPDPAHVSSPARGAALTATLGGCHALLIRAHGVVVVAESVRTLFADCVHFVENAEALHRAAQLGRVEALTDEELEAFAAAGNRQRHADKLWDYYSGLGIREGALDNID